jgi:NTE family protein
VLLRLAAPQPGKGKGRLMPSIALVLGAGGVLGGAYHAGTLAALEHAGWDPRSADLIVGTSAGSVAGSVLRAGLSASDQLARVQGRRLSREGEALVAGAELGPPGEVPVAPAPRSRRPANPALVARAWLPFGGVRPGVALAGAVPRGSFPTEVISAPLDRLLPRWPDAPLWLCSVRLADGVLVVAGRDDVDTTVGQAAAASCAVPGLFEPVRLGGRLHVDGGAHSPTHAAVVAGLGHDLVVVISPMSGTSASLRRFPIGPRPLFARRLGSEVAAVRRAGTPVLTFQPSPSEAAIMRTNPMRRDRAEPVAEAAYAAARDRLAHHSVADRLAVLLA